jgi:heme A synthase
VQVSVGITNVLFLVPDWLQIAHLFVADVLWVLLVLASADLLLERNIICPVCGLASALKEGQEA